MAKNIIGVDIGGTNTRGILWDGRKIIKSRNIKTPQTRSDFENELRKLIAFLGEGKEIFGIGIGVAAVIDGTIFCSNPNIPAIKNFNFVQLRDPTPLKGSDPAMKVDNDARTFAIGEYFLGAGKGFKRAFFLTIGTGVGRAFGKNGKILKIKKFEYSERWEREYQRIRDKKNDAELTKFLGRHLSRLIKPHKPQAIIIGGGVALDRKNFISKLRCEFVKNGIKAKILKSRLGWHSAALGATLLFK